MPGQRAAQIHVEEEHEERQRDRLDRADEGQIGEQLAEEDAAPRHRREQQPVERAVLPLDRERAVERHHRRERERHPQHARRQVDRGDGGRIAGEVEHHQHQRREHHRGEQRGAAPQLRPDVLRRDREREPERLRHRPVPGSGEGTPRASPRAARRRPSGPRPAPPPGSPPPTPRPGDGSRSPRRAPRRAVAASSARSRSAAAASSAVNGSSSSRTRGPWSSARAIAARWARPRLSRRGDSSARAARPAASRAARAARGGPRQPVEPGGEGEVLRQGEVVVEQRLVGDEPDRRAGRRGRGPAAGPAEDADFAGLGPHQSREQAEQRGLSGAVGPGDHHRLARPQASDRRRAAPAARPNDRRSPRASSSAGSAPSEDGIDAGAELVETEGFDDVAGVRQVEHLELGLDAQVGGGDDDREARAGSRRMRRSSSMPSVSGRRMSSTATSGRCCSSCSSASAPLRGERQIVARPERPLVAEPQRRLVLHDEHPPAARRLGHASHPANRCRGAPRLRREDASGVH